MIRRTRLDDAVPLPGTSLGPAVQGSCTRRRHPQQYLAAVGTAAAATILLAACSYLSPSTVSVPYDAGDGVGGQVGDIAVRNFVLVAKGADSPGVLSGALVNEGSAATSVTLSAADGGGSAATVSVPAQSSVVFGSTGGPSFQLPKSPAPGLVARLMVRTPAAGGLELNVPVLPPTELYAEVTPTPTTRRAAPPVTSTVPGDHRALVSTSGGSSSAG